VARVRGVAREALAGTTVSIADTAVRALGDIGVVRGSGREELVHVEVRSAHSHGLVPSNAHGDTPVGGDVGGDHVSHIVHLLVGIVGVEGPESVPDIPLIGTSVQSLGSVQVDVRRVDRGHLPVQHSEHVRLVQAVEDVLKLVGIIITHLRS